MPAPIPVALAGSMGAVVKVVLFGKLADLVGRELRLDPAVRCATIGELRRALARAHPRAAAGLLSRRVRAFVNDAMVGDGHRLSPGDEVALLPPVSGG